MDEGDSHDEGRDLELQGTSVQLTQPAELFVVILNIDTRDEILVSGELITTRLATSTMSIRARIMSTISDSLHGPNMAQNMKGFLEKLHAQGNQGQRNAGIDQGQDPAAGEKQLFDHAFQHNSGYFHRYSNG